MVIYGRMVMRRVVLAVLTSALFSYAYGENVRGLAELADSGEWALAVSSLLALRC